MESGRSFVHPFDSFHSVPFPGEKREKAASREQDNDDNETRQDDDAKIQVAKK